MALKEIKYKNKIFKLSYEIVNPSKEEVLLVLHGWGSNKEIMKQAFGKTLQEYKHLYVDMVGFGKSSSPQMVLTSQDYAEIMKVFLKAFHIFMEIK